MENLSTTVDDKECHEMVSFIIRTLRIHKITQYNKGKVSCQKVVGKLQGPRVSKELSHIQATRKRLCKLPPRHARIAPWNEVCII